MRLLIISLLMVGSAYAGEQDEAVKKAMFRLTTAYQCAQIIEDDGPYEWTKTNAATLVGDEKAAVMIAYVEAQGTDGSPLNEKFCRNMTKNFHD